MFQAIARVPASARDVALLADVHISSAEIESIIGAHRLVDGVFPIDTYVGEEIPGGNKSVTYRIIFQSDTGTLAASDIDKAQTQIMRSLNHQLNVSERFSSD